MSEGKGIQTQDLKKEEAKKKIEGLKEDQTENAILELKEMFSQFLISSNQTQASNRTDINELKEAIKAINRSSTQSPMGSESMETPYPVRSRGSRRSSMFFGISQLPSTPQLMDTLLADTPFKSNIQVLQADIVYDKELKVSSLEGLQYLARQLQLLSSKYPGREIKMAHMVSYNLRPHVVASWNSHRYRESLITGLESNEIMVEDWLSLSNSEVQAILVEAARPRTKELYSKELILFLGKGIPQAPSITTENFSSTFYAPLMKSLTDLHHLHDLMSEETSNHSMNKSKIPIQAYGTRDSPGQIALWLISLGTQKDSILQWLSKDELVKHKTLESSVKFIRARLMEGRAQSESRQDFDAKLTPIRYEDLRYTQGESHTRQQISAPNRPQFTTPRRHDQRLQSNFASIELSTQQMSSTHDNENDEDTEDENAPTYSAEDLDLSNDANAEISTEDSLLAISTDQHRSRSAVSATFRGFCSEAFVYGRCTRQSSGCTFDHSTAGQERCIQSFTLLAKRELQQHGQLEPWSSPKQEPSSNLKTNNSQSFKTTSSTNFRGVIKPTYPSTSTRPNQK
jgi:hypothetical protein